MRKNLNKLARIVFALSIVLLLANCDRNEPLGQDNTTPIIANAKSSFEDYKSNMLLPKNQTKFCTNLR
jgi:uncharacterized lipoprotein YehR (DUF1307 family)